MIAAPASGQGKTVISAALLALLRQRGVRAAAAKVGPDYIDPAFHAAALGFDDHATSPVVNLDAWAMPRAELAARLAALAEDAEMVVIEAVMGLFDGAAKPGRTVAAANACDVAATPTAGEAGMAGAPNASVLAGIGSSADLAAMFGIPVLLVLDASRMAASAAAVVHGFASLRRDVHIAGVILNRLGSPRHGDMLAALVEEVTGVAVVGRFLRGEELALPERHLGLVPVGEHDRLADWLKQAANVAAQSLSLCRLANLTQPLRLSATEAAAHRPLPPLGQRMAIARDDAFCFLYPHLLADWRAQGVEISFFSPLADEAPAEDADAVFLPGGYPELHGARLAAARGFRQGMRAAAARGALIYGECGGFMVLGRGLVDARGEAHEMCDLLPVSTSFADRQLHLGYRQLRHDSALPFPARLRGHEFHYARIVWRDAAAQPLFEACDAASNALEPMGAQAGRVMGSFAHVLAAGTEAA